MPRKALGTLLIVMVCASGCLYAPPAPEPDPESIIGHIQRLEGKVEAREEDVLKLQAEVSSLQAEREELKQLIERTRETVRGLETSGAVPAEKPFKFEVVRVGFGFLTCAIDLDEKKGDDAVAAYVYLYDQFGSSLKAAGSFRFELFDLSRKKAHVIRSWSFKPEAAATYWQRFPASYQFKLPFASDMRVEKVILKVTFQQVGKEELTATREVEVELP